MDGEFREFDDLETRLKELIRAELNIDISDLEPIFKDIPDLVFQSDTKATIQLKLDWILRNNINLGLAVIGRTPLSYWAIGTHTPHGYVSKIIDDKSQVIYESDESYDYSGPSWGIGIKEIAKHRKEINWQSKEDPPNPFLIQQNYHQHNPFPALSVSVSPSGFRFPEVTAKICTQIFYLPGKICDYVVSLLRFS